MKNPKISCRPTGGMIHHNHFLPPLLHRAKPVVSKLAFPIEVLVASRISSLIIIVDFLFSRPVELSIVSFPSTTNIIISKATSLTQCGLSRIRILLSVTTFGRSSLFLRNHCKLVGHLRKF